MKHTPDTKVCPKPEVLITRKVFGHCVDELKEHYKVHYQGNTTAADAAWLKSSLPNCQAVLCQLTDKVDADFMQMAPHLKVISTLAVGFDNIDTEAASQRGIFVCNTPDVLTSASADHTMALLLAAARRLHEARIYIDQNKWQQWELDQLCGADLFEKQLGIVGAGRIGLAVAKRAAAFGLKIKYYNRNKLSDAIESQYKLSYSPLNELLSDSDFLSLHLPLNADSEKLINKESFKQMKSSAILINTARGTVIDQEDLIYALENKLIAAAGLDVFADEPHIPTRLKEMHNVILSPHIGSATVGTRRKMAELAIADIRLGLSGSKPLHLVNAKGLNLE